jgi:hypothetical protein
MATHKTWLAMCDYHKEGQDFNLVWTIKGFFLTFSQSKFGLCHDSIQRPQNWYPLSLDIFQDLKSESWLLGCFNLNTRIDGAKDSAMVPSSLLVRMLCCHFSVQKKFCCWWISWPAAYYCIIVYCWIPTSLLNSNVILKSLKNKSTMTKTNLPTWSPLVS